jgi:hypothetical protein
VCLSVERSLHAPFIASRRYRVTRRWCVGDPSRGSSPKDLEGLIRWRRGLHYRGMVLVLLVLLLHGVVGVPLLREWFLSFGIVAVRPVIPGPVAGVAFRSLRFDLAWMAEATGAGNAARSRSDRGNSGRNSCSILCARTNRAYSAIVGGIVDNSSPPCLLRWWVW